MIKAIAFDFDGVLMDTYSRHFAIYKEKYFNMDKELHKKLFEGNIVELRKNLKEKVDLDIGKVYEKYFIDKKMDKKVIEFLKDLKKQYTLFVVSSSKDDFLNKFFENNNILDLFEWVMGRDTEVKKTKKFEMIFKKYNLKSEEILFVTDTLGDVLEANEVGVRSIAVDFGFHERERLMRGKPLKIVSSFDELKDFIFNNNL